MHVSKKGECPRGHSPFPKFCINDLLLVENEVNVHSASHRASHHRVVTDTEEGHHFNVGRNRRRTCELSVAVHTAESVGHTIRSGTCSHVIGVQGATGTTTGCH